MPSRLSRPWLSLRADAGGLIVAFGLKRTEDLQEALEQDLLLGCRKLRGRSF